MKLASSKHRQPLAEINIIPFVDVVLVLLIIFMITAPLLQQSLDVELPQVEAPESNQSPGDLILTINQAGDVFIGTSKKPVSTKYLKAKLQAIYRNKKNKDLQIRADTDLQYGKVMEVVSIAQLAGVERIGMITQPKIKNE